MTPRLEAIGIVVSDMAASLDFYRRLGVAVPEDTDADGHAMVELETGIRLMWDTRELIHGFDPSWTAPTGSPRVALAFALPDPAGVDRLYAELAGLGFGHKEPWDAFWGQRYAMVRDPDGNGVDLFASLEGFRTQ